MGLLYQFQGTCVPAILLFKSGTNYLCCEPYVGLKCWLLKWLELLAISGSYMYHWADEWWLRLVTTVSDLCSQAKPLLGVTLVAALDLTSAAENAGLADWTLFWWPAPRARVKLEVHQLTSWLDWYCSLACEYMLSVYILTIDKFMSSNLWFTV